VEAEKAALVDYILEHGDSLEFTRHFWKGCEPIRVDIIQHWKFTTAQKLLCQGYRNTEISAKLDVSPATISTWRNLKQMPKLGHYLNAYLALGNPPDDCRWLTLECSHGHGIPIGKFLSVPVKMENWNQMSVVLAQVPNLNPSPSKHSREYQLGFLFGILIGDAAKTKSKYGASHRHIGLVLSKKYETNQRICDFTSFCARSFGLRMHRTEDLERPSNKPNGFYQWVSQASPLVDWAYNIALGLKDGELTTYDAVRADWTLSAPRDFRVGLIQGIAESDGSVNIASQTIEFWVDPHRNLLKKLPAMEGLNSFNNRQALSITKTQAIASFSVPIFSADLQTVRYKRHELMVRARKLGRDERIPFELRNKIKTLSKQGLSVPSIIQTLAEVDGVLISFEACQRWAGMLDLVQSGASGEDNENHARNGNNWP